MSVQFQGAPSGSCKRQVGAICPGKPRSLSTPPPPPGAGCWHSYRTASKGLVFSRMGHRTSHSCLKAVRAFWAPVVPAACSSPSNQSHLSRKGLLCQPYVQMHIGCLVVWFPFRDDIFPFPITHPAHFPHFENSR